MTNNIIPIKLSGIVTRFQGNGRKLGYPTANFTSPTTLDDGIYFGFANLDTHHHHPALIFIGIPVTVGDTERRVEAHLLDIIDQDYYDLPLTLEIKHFHRPNQAFISTKKLLEAIKSDEHTARQWFGAQLD